MSSASTRVFAFALLFSSITALTTLAPSVSSARAESEPVQGATGITRSAPAPSVGARTAMFNGNVVRSIGQATASSSTCADLRNSVYRNDVTYVRQNHLVRVVYSSGTAACDADAYLAPARFGTTDSTRCEVGYTCVDLTPPPGPGQSERWRRLDEMRERPFESPSFQSPFRRW